VQATVKPKNAHRGLDCHVLGVLEDFCSTGTGSPGETDQYRECSMSAHAVSEGYGMMSRGERAAGSRRNESQGPEAAVWQLV
jgi:hypothetical protein